jgi:4-amino-4-deoxy-L-arabinose transferase-like glycosyltransferase
MTFEEVSTLLEQPRVQSLLLFLLALSILFAHVGEGHLANFDDCYYAQKAKEMVRSGSWLTPTYEGQVRIDNPPLFLWIMAGSFLVLGIRDYAAILPSALSGACAVLLLHRLAFRLGWGAFGAWCAAVVLLTTQYFLKYARHAMFDVFLTLLFLAAMLAYLDRLEGRRGRAIVIGILCGLGVLTKSVLGLFPLLVAALHLVWVGRARDLPRMVGAAAAVAFLMIAPWYGYELATHRAQFVNEHIRWLLLERGFGARAGEPGWMNSLGYLRDLAIYDWPWLPASVAGIVLAAQRLRGRGGEPPPQGAEGDRAFLGRGALKLLVVWAALVIGIMSIGREKKLWYIMSVFPCLALFAALALDRWIRTPGLRRQVLLGSAVFLGALATWLNLGPFRPSARRDPGLYQIALVAKELVPPGSKVVNFDNGYWSHQNLFLFYSDHGLTLPISDPGKVRTMLDRGSFALVKAAKESVIASPSGSRYRAIVRSGDWVLMAKRDVGPVEIQARDPFR